jgi:hypothetical protein
MGAWNRTCRYFERPGKENTDQVVQAVLGRLAVGDLQTVIVSSTTGYTALKFASALSERMRKESPPEAKITLVSVAETPLIREWGHEYPCLPSETRDELERKGVIVADRVPYLFHSSVLDQSRWKAPSPEEIVRDTLYAFGQGLKVAVEVALIAVASGHVGPFQDVIAVGGTSRGADTAIVLRATFPNHVLSQDGNKRLVIHEILCKPI